MSMLEYDHDVKMYLWIGRWVERLIMKNKVRNKGIILKPINNLIVNSDVFSPICLLLKLLSIAFVKQS